MIMNRHFLIVGAIAAIGLLGVCAFVDSSSGQEHNYQFEGDITLPEHRTDLDKMIDAYERMFDRLLYAMESGGTTNADINAISKKLSDIDSKLTILDAKLARMEKTLGSQKQTLERNEINQLTNEAKDINDNTTGIFNSASNEP
ncbi:MAG: hypothetical protein ABFD79_15760 [Phycisphaerales bacterium]